VFLSAVITGVEVNCGAVLSHASTVTDVAPVRPYGETAEISQIISRGKLLALTIAVELADAERRSVVGAFQVRPDADAGAG
jgi:hypothetical protein